MDFNRKKLITCFALAFFLSGCTFIPSDDVASDIKQKLENDNSQNGMISNYSDNYNNSVKSIEEELTAQNNIVKFNNYDELREFLEEETSVEYGYGSGMMRGGIMEESLVMDGAKSISMTEMSMPTATDQKMGIADTDNNRDFSETNIQVAGVDEADIIKTDGDYIYAVTYKDLYIIKAYPVDEAEVVTKISFDSTPQNIYINGDRLVVFGRDDMIYQTELYKSFGRRGSYSFLKVFDISDKKNPKQLRDLDFEGDYTDSRMIGSYVYLVTNTNNIFYYDDELPVPRIIDDGKVINSECESGGNCVMPDVYYFDMPYTSHNFTTVSAINTANNDESVSSDVYILNYGQNMYVSERNIYITYTKYISEYELMMDVAIEIVSPLLNDNDQKRIAGINSVDNYILNQNEKRNKISAIIERFLSRLSDDERNELEKKIENTLKEKYKSIADELEKTVIQKVAINKSQLDYKGYGEVKGRVLNQFSMDENNGYFRIATTKDRTWSRYEEEVIEPSSYLFVLDENLKEVGSIEGLAEGETIYSVRFMQNRAYMVTFKQTDPLFVIDLTYPNSPKVLGELKIPGYSDYLHPFDENTLIGFGKDTSETEWGGVRTEGLKLSLFDVSDVSKPKVIDTYIMGDAGSDSIALQDRKAFLFSPDKGLLSIPVNIRENTGEYYSPLSYYSGAAVFGVTKKGFEFKGKIDHSDGGKAGIREDWYGYNYYDNTVKRSLYIEDALYTFSSKYIKINNISNLKELDKIELKKERTDKQDFEIIN